ncbi:CDP-glucose 4,6-dehydratase [[Clostridium] sordellii VPI 9048]|nr:CDP-glucose 4,6-dehydratase [[Clostridium] sordellii VPI 9048] [Paeniclostridium sordellii VPI 9048]CEK39031.1 hypothetical protein JGS6382_23631 [[Clostridium] sordellii] [Paeniclostridium sordellii]
MENMEIVNCFKGVYKDKVVLVTGHTGFKGSWICMWLNMLGAKVIGYSQEPNTNPNLFDICNLEKNMVSVIGDIRDEECLYNTIKKYKPEIIFHMAAQPLVRLSYEEPKMTYETNVIGTLNLFEVVRKSNCVKSIINITTDKCYENKEWIYGYRETDSMGGYDPYSSSKACVELLTNSYRNSFFKKQNIGIATVRAGNVIGGGDWSKDRLIPDIVKNISINNEITIRNPDAVRPWQHVLEPLSGYLWLGCLIMEDNERYGQGWNFGPEDSDILRVKEVLDTSIEIWNKGKYKIDLSEQPHEAKLLKLDISKAKMDLKWKPVYNSYEAIHKTIDWYVEFYERNSDMREFTINQIKEYTKKAINNKLLWSVK